MKKRMLSMILALVMLVSIVPMVSAKGANKVDVVFVIDSTASMREEINGVKNNLYRFTEKLEVSGIDYQIAVVDYEDITHDGDDSTRVLTKDGQKWFSTTEDVETVISSIKLGDGGDYPETLVDAFGCMLDELTFRTESSKFAIVLTDDRYKNENNYGYTGMSDMIAALQTVGICTSVISTNSYKTVYEPLYTGTDGVFCDIYGNFADELVKLADHIEEVVNPVEIRLETEEINNDGTQARYRLKAAVASTDEEKDTTDLKTTLILPDGVTISSGASVCAEAVLAPLAEVSYEWEVVVTVGEADAVYKWSVRAESDDFATGVVCQAQDSFGVIGSGKADYGFVFGKDNYCFGNGYDEFGKGEIYVSDRDLAAYLANLSATEIQETASGYARKVYRTDRPDLLDWETTIANLRRNDLKNWNGSCYGLTLTTALFKMGLKSPTAFGAETPYQLTALTESSNTELESFINISHMTQCVGYATDSKWNLEEMWQMGSDIGKAGTLQQPYLVRLRYEYMDGEKLKRVGHAVLCYGAQTGSYNYNGTQYNKRLLIADPNKTEETYIYIADDFENAIYSGNHSYTMFGYRNATLSELNAYDYHDSRANYNAKLDAQNMTELVVESEVGKAVIIANKVISLTGSFSAEEEIYDDEGESSGASVILLNDDVPWYKLSSKDGVINATVYFGTYSVSVYAKAASVIVYKDGTVEILDGEDDVYLDMAVNDSDFSFLGISGEADGDISLALDEETATLTGELSDYTVKEYDMDGNQSELSVDGDDDIQFSVEDEKLNANLDTDGNGTFETPYDDEDGRNPLIDLIFGGGGTSNPFKDVKKTDWFYDAVMWAVREYVTAGTSSNTFSPGATCTRGQMVTFLWRAAGCPDPGSYSNPFKDVDKDSYYGKAVLWAVGEGITQGTSKTAFSPNAQVTRGQMVTFLYRYAGAANSNKTPAFSDVKSGAYYFDAVQWAYAEGVANGMSEHKFAPESACTRGQIVTFLYRYFA